MTNKLQIQYDSTNYKNAYSASAALPTVLIVYLYTP